MLLYADGIDVDEEIVKCYEQIEYWSGQLERLQNQKKEEERLNNLCKTLNRCHRCVYGTNCNMSEMDSDGNCKKYKREAKDGGFYG